jgi:hypothetical protein
MVTLNPSGTARSVSQVLESQDVGAMLTVAGGTAAGVIIAQRLSDRILPRIGLSATPSSLTDAIGSAGFKGVAALAVGMASAELSGLPQTFAVFIALGHLTSAGVDLLQVFTELPSLQQSMMSSGGSTNLSGNPTTKTVSASGSSTKTVSASGSSSSSGNFGSASGGAW